MTTIRAARGGTWCEPSSTSARPPPRTFCLSAAFLLQTGAMMVASYDHPLKHHPHRRRYRHRCAADAPCLLAAQIGIPNGQPGGAHAPPCNVCLSEPLWLPCLSPSPARDGPKALNLEPLPNCGPNPAARCGCVATSSYPQAAPLATARRLLAPTSCALPERAACCRPGAASLLTARSPRVFPLQPALPQSNQPSLHVSACRSRLHAPAA